MRKLLLLLALLSQHGFAGTLALTGCGKPLISDKIVGGTDSIRGEWPWQVSLMFNDVPHCGGSLISDSWVLTAAHCFDLPLNISAYAMYLGVYKLSKLQESTTVVRRMKQVVIHDDFTEEGAAGDIALVELEKPVNFNLFILPVCLPSEPLKPMDGTMCWATGWGDIKDGVPLAIPRPLQEVKLPLIDRDKCETMYRESLGYSARFHLIKEDMLCAGYKDGTKDSCQGDSGGPLACKVKGVWVQMGINSWGFGCAEPDHPGVYTSVQYYQSWIQDSMIPLKISNGPNGVLTQTFNGISNIFKFKPRNSSRTYILYEQNSTESGNLTDYSNETKIDVLLGNRAHSDIWSLANAVLLLLGPVLLL